MVIDESLASFIEFNKRNFAYEACGIYDLNHNCLYASKIFLKYIGINDLVGKPIASVSDDFKDLSIGLREAVTLKVIKYKKPYLSFFMLPNLQDDNFGVHQLLTYPIFDVNDNVIAYYSRSSQLLHGDATSRMFSSISITSNSTSFNQGVLTERERIIVFLLIIGLSHKEIAALLSSVYNEEISLSSVSTMISRQIYHKFDTRVTSVLVQKAIQSGMLYNIPPKLVGKLPKVFYVEDYTSFCEKYGFYL